MSTPKQAGLTKHQLEVLTEAAKHERGNLPRGFAGPSITTLLLLRDRGYIVEERDLDDAGVAEIQRRQAEKVTLAQAQLIAGNWRKAYHHLNIAAEHDLRLERKVWRITAKGREALGRAT